MRFLFELSILAEFYKRIRFALNCLEKLNTSNLILFFNSTGEKL